MLSSRLIISLVAIFLLISPDLTAQSGNIKNMRFTHLTSDDGFPDSWTQAALMDQQGFIWLATIDGLFRYDGHKFKVYKNDPDDPNSINGLNIMDLVESEDGRIWIAAIGGGVNEYDPETNTFKSYQFPVENSFIERFTTVCLQADEDNKLWVGTFDSGFFEFDQVTKKFRHYNLSSHFTNHSEAFRRNSVHEIIINKYDQNELWIAGNNGLYQFDKAAEKLNYHPFEIDHRIDTMTAALTVFSDRKNEIWIGSWGLGLVKYSQESGRFDYHIPAPDLYAAKNYFSNIIDDIERKSEHELWICSRDQGLLIFNTQTNTFTEVETDPTNKSSILSDEVNGIYVDRNDRKWVFNYQSGISILDPANQAFQLDRIGTSNLCNQINDAQMVDFCYDRKRAYTYITTIGCEGLFVLDRNYQLLASERLHPILPASVDRYSMTMDNNYKLWLAGGTGTDALTSLYTFDPDQLTLTAFEHPDLKGIPLHHYKLTGIANDPMDRIWLITAFEGLICIDQRSNTIRQYVQSDVHPDYPHRQINFSDIVIAQDGRIWMSTLVDGVFAFDPETEQFKHYPEGKNGEPGLTDKRILSIEVDKEGMIWAGTADSGVDIIDPNQESIAPVRHLRRDAGLLSEKIYQMTQFGDQEVWVGTSQGLCRYDEKDDRFICYNKIDGIAEPVFADQSIKMLSDGRLLIGQSNAFLTLRPQEMYDNTTLPSVAFTGFNLFEKPVSFEKSINFTERIELSYDQNFFSIEFAALHFTQPEKNNYAYKLEGYDKGWIYPGQNRNFASYTKVAPGNYTFRLKASNNQNIWSPDERTINIIVHSPPWATWWAYLIYAILIGGALYFLYRYQLQRQIDIQEAQRLKELDELRTKLYNNITHEFRTPLTVILGHLNRALSDNQRISTDELLRMKRNGDQLLSLINQMLDLGKLDAGAMQINLVKLDVVNHLEYLTDSFVGLADEKKINLDFSTSTDHLEVDADLEKLTIVITNLLSNAIKFTKSKEHIFIRLETKNVQEEKYKIVIQDTGLGISEQDLPFIFDRFYQIGSDQLSKGTQEQASGTGIGLALVKEVVELMQGEIKVESKLNQGTTFTLLFPKEFEDESSEIIEQNHVPAVQQNTLINSVDPKANLSSPVIDVSEEEKAVVLLVEDNEDLRAYISSCLKSRYQLLVANNGKQGVELAKQHIPDLILSDVMMPIMGGFELLRQLKADPLTNHIPIIILTARSGHESLIEGLDKGADSYLTKPFNEHELLLRIKNLIENRSRLQQHFINHFGLDGASELLSKSKNDNDQVTVEEDQFVISLKAIIDEYIDDPALNVSFLGKKIGMSHTQLHRKLVALTGLPPVKFIKKLRMQKAKGLLNHSELSISEIAYAVGFSDPAYFSRVFKSEFEVSPRKFRND